MFEGSSILSCTHKSGFIRSLIAVSVWKHRHVSFVRSPHCLICRLLHNFSCLYCKGRIVICGNITFEVSLHICNTKLLRSVLVSHSSPVAMQSKGLWQLSWWVYGFESRRGHGTSVCRWGLCVTRYRMVCLSVKLNRWQWEGPDPLERPAPWNNFIIRAIYRCCIIGRFSVADKNVIWRVPPNFLAILWNKIL
jgi:hypothetical protein